MRIWAVSAPIAIPPPPLFIRISLGLTRLPSPLTSTSAVQAHYCIKVPFTTSCFGFRILKPRIPRQTGWHFDSTLGQLWCFPALTSQPPGFCSLIFCITGSWVQPQAVSPFQAHWQGPGPGHPQQVNLAISWHGWRLANKKSVGERNIGTDCWLPMSCIWPTTTSCTRLKARQWHWYWQWHCWSLSSWWRTPIVKSYDHWTLIVFNIGQAPINRLQWRPVRLIPGRNWIWKQIFNDLNDFLINYEDFLGSNICIKQENTNWKTEERNRRYQQWSNYSYLVENLWIKTFSPFANWLNWFEIIFSRLVIVHDKQYWKIDKLVTYCFVLAESMCFK